MKKELEALGRKKNRKEDTESGEYKTLSMLHKSSHRGSRKQKGSISRQRRPLGKG